MKTTILTKTWNESHAACYGAPAGTDVCHVEFTHHTFNGRVYQTETAYRNGIVTQSAEYPADKPYAAKRLEQFA